MARLLSTLLLGLTLTACGPESTEAPVCAPGLPPASQLLAKPALQPLHYYTRVNYQAVRGAGSDIWGDSKFEYGAAIQYTLVPDRASARDGPQYCAKAVALRLALPLDAAKEQMLATFLAELPSGTTVGVGDLQPRIRGIMAREERYRTLVRQGTFAIAAGRVTHPNRGDFFVVSFDWSLS